MTNTIVTITYTTYTENVTVSNAKQEKELMTIVEKDPTFESYEVTTQGSYNLGNIEALTRKQRNAIKKIESTDAMLSDLQEKARNHRDGRDYMSQSERRENDKLQESAIGEIEKMVQRFSKFTKDQFADFYGEFGEDLHECYC